MTLQPIELLLVEDNEDDIVLIQEAFGEARLVNVIHVVRDGEEALAYLRKKPPYQAAATPGLVLLDINMPKKDGFQVLEEMKANGHLRQVPVIMLTTSDRDEDVTRSYKNGASSYIRKPVDFHSFCRLVEHFEIYWALVAKLPERG